MCFSVPEMQTPQAIPESQGAQDAKGTAYKRARGKSGYASTLLTGGASSGSAAASGPKRLLGE